MPYNELLLPLLGGYVFLRQFSLTSFRISGLTGYVVLFESAVAGVVMVLVSWVLKRFCELSQSAEFLHQIIFPITVVILISLIYGANLTIRRSRQKPDYYDKLNEEQQSKDRVRRSKRLTSGILGVVAAVILTILIIVHGYQDFALVLNWASLFWTIGFISLVAALIFWLRSNSTTPGHEITLRAGWALLLTLGLLMVGSAVSPSLSAIWTEQFSNNSDKVGGVFALSLLVGLIGGRLSNLVVDWNSAFLIRLSSGDVNTLEEFLYKQGTRVLPVSMTLLDRKAYVGWVDHENPIRGRADDYVVIVPIASGYRSSEKMELELTTFYEDTFSDAIRKSTVPSERMRKLWGLRKIVPIDRIASVGPFDAKVYKKFLEERKKAQVAENKIKNKTPNRRKAAPPVKKVTKKKAAKN